MRTIMFLGSITIIQVKTLESIFAEFKGDSGWVLPEWLIFLKRQVVLRDSGVQS